MKSGRYDYDRTVSQPTTSPRIGRQLNDHQQFDMFQSYERTTSGQSGIYSHGKDLKLSSLASTDLRKATTPHSPAGRSKETRDYYDPAVTSSSPRDMVRPAATKRSSLRPDQLKEEFLNYSKGLESYVEDRHQPTTPAKSMKQDATMSISNNQRNQKLLINNEEVTGRQHASRNGQFDSRIDQFDSKDKSSHLTVATGKADLYRPFDRDLHTLAVAPPRDKRQDSKAKQVNDYRDYLAKEGFGVSEIGRPSVDLHKLSAATSRDLQRDREGDLTPRDKRKDMRGQPVNTYRDYYSNDGIGTDETGRKAIKANSEIHYEPMSPSYSMADYHKSGIDVKSGQVKMRKDTTNTGLANNSDDKLKGKVALTSGIDESKSRSKNSLTKSPTETSEANKRNAVSDLKRDLLKDKAQLDDKFNVSAAGKDSRRLQWEDGWQRSPEKAYERFQKAKVQSETSQLSAPKTALAGSRPGSFFDTPSRNSLREMKEDFLYGENERGYFSRDGHYDEEDVYDPRSLRNSRASSTLSMADAHHSQQRRDSSGGGLQGDPFGWRVGNSNQLNTRNERDSKPRLGKADLGSGRHSGSDRIDSRVEKSNNQSDSRPGNAGRHDGDQFDSRVGKTSSRSSHHQQIEQLDSTGGKPSNRTGSKAEQPTSGKASYKADSIHGKSSPGNGYRHDSDLRAERDSRSAIGYHRDTDELYSRERIAGSAIGPQNINGYLFNSSTDWRDDRRHLLYSNESLAKYEEFVRSPRNIRTTGALYDNERHHEREHVKHRIDNDRHHEREHVNHKIDNDRHQEREHVNHRIDNDRHHEREHVNHRIDNDRHHEREHVNHRIDNDRLHANSSEYHQTNRSKDRKKPSFSPRADLSGTKYKTVRDVVGGLGFVIDLSGLKKCSLIWNDSFISMEKVALLRPHQRINHFFGMAEMCKKDTFANLISKMYEVYPAEFTFFPRTWIFPREVHDFKRHTMELSKKHATRKTYIVKPVSESARRNRIQLYLRSEDCLTSVDVKPLRDDEPVLIQEYIEQPLVLQGHKCHLRLYVLISSVQPLRCYLYEDGVFHLAADKYLAPAENNTGQLSVHITTADSPVEIDKHQSPRSKHKKKISLRMLYAQMSRTDSLNLHASLSDMVVKTILSLHPHIFLSYQLCRVGQGSDLHSETPESVCFELLGFDVLLDRNLKPFLLQVIRSPSLAVSPLDDVDCDIKTGVLEDALRLLAFRDLSSDHVDNKDLENAMNVLNELEKDQKETSSIKSKGQSKPGDSTKDELVNMVRRMRSDSSSKVFAEDCGNFKQIFPPRDKSLLEKYLKLVELACSLYEPEFDEKRKLDIQKFLVRKRIEEIQKDLLAGKEHTSKSEQANKLQKIDIDEKTARRTLDALNKTSIVFPNKSSKAAESALDKIVANWKMHKKQVANYWFICLDNAKRNEVINIVREKVREAVQKVWQRAHVENVGLYRAFDRLFNRMLANHGQGLWDCLVRNNSWETVLVKSSTALNPVELACCRRVVQMCCDAVLVTFLTSSATTIESSCSA